MEHMWLMRRSGRSSRTASGTASGKASPATRLTVAGLAVTCSVSLASSVVAHADSVSDQKKRNDQKIAALGQQLEGTNASLARAYVNLQRTNAAPPIAQQRVTYPPGEQVRAPAAEVGGEATEAGAIVAEAKARAHNEAVAQKLAGAQANEQREKE